jgi:hypothetical protein
MDAGMTYTIISLGALLFGGAVGIIFGILQHRALLRDQKRQEGKSLKRRRLVIPSSFRRIFYLIMLLMAIQYVCPFLFRDSSTQWILTAGIVIGYGWTLLKRIRTYKGDYKHTALV